MSGGEGASLNTVKPFDSKFLFRHLKKINDGYGKIKTVDAGKGSGNTISGVLGKKN